jgi:hypothetical protein
VPKRWKPYGIGARSPSQTARLFVEDDIILLGVEVILSGLMTHWMMPWTPSLSGTKRPIEPMTPEQRARKLDAEMEKQDAAMAKLESSVAENKEASGEIKKSIENLEAVTEKIEDGKS